MSCGPCQAAHVECGDCSRASSGLPSWLEVAADPVARKLGARPTMGKLLPTFVTPSSVRDLKARLHPTFVSTDADVKACAKLDDRKRAAWSGFFASWLNYRAAEETFWGVTAEYETGLVFEKSLQAWQDELAECKLSAPRLKTIDEAAGNDLSAVKWAAGAVIVVALVYGLRTVIK